ncbi:hypothetical protein ES703_73687 [subsurface metagenome]
MTNPITPPLTFEPLNLETCRANRQWCKKEITKRLMLLLLEYTRSKPLPFMAHIEPFGPGPPRPPPQSAPEPSIYTIFSNISDSVLRNTDKSTWTLARDSAASDAANDTAQSYSFSAQAERPAALFYCARSFFDFDLSSIPASKTIASATLSLTTTGPYAHTISIQKGTQNIPSTVNDFQAFTGALFLNKTTSIGLNIITLNAAAITYLQSVLISTAKLCVREYNFDYLDVAPTALFGRVGLYYSDTPTDADKPTLTITTD